MAKRKLTKTGRFFLNLLLVISFGTACFSGYKLYESFREYGQGSHAYEDIHKGAVIPVPEKDEDTIDFEYLLSVNPDTAAWIRLKDSAVDYPVVYGSGKERDWYLTHLFTGEYNRSGCIYLDENNVYGLTDKNLVFYGHHMRNGTMFADIQKYESQSWYESHKEILLYTPDSVYTIYPAAGIFTVGTDPYVRFDFADDADFADYVNYFVSGSTFVSDTVIGPADQIALLSTCSYNVNDGRYVLIGKVVRTG